MGVEGVGGADRGKIVSIGALRSRRAAAESAGDPGAPPASEEPRTEDARSDAAKSDRSESERPDPKKLMAAYREFAESLPEVRADKVIDAKLRISTGYYESDEVRRGVLRSILCALLPPSARPDEPPPGPDAGTHPDAPEEDAE